MKRLIYALLFVIPFMAIAQEAVKPELLPQKNANNTYFGVTLNDPYQYLENLDDPMVVTWMKDNANYATSILNNISGGGVFFFSNMHFNSINGIIIRKYFDTWN